VSAGATSGAFSRSVSAAAGNGSLGISDELWQLASSTTRRQAGKQPERSIMNMIKKRHHGASILQTKHPGKAETGHLTAQLQRGQGVYAGSPV
jgi:hypothetical protein